MKKIFMLSLLAAVACGGCGNMMTHLNTPERQEQGLVIVLTGVEGVSNLNRDICRGLDVGMSPPMAIQLTDWTNQWMPPGWDQLTDDRNRRKARELADQIEQYKINHPNKPIYLVGQSGGGAIAIWMAEELRPETQIEGIILLAASISSTYNLDLALSHCRRGMINFYSQKDWVLLGAGTTVFGTMDRKHAESAGKLGFEPVAIDNPANRKKLFQKAWDPSMQKAGYTGNHVTSGDMMFIADYVAPLINAKEWNVKTIEYVFGKAAGVYK